MNIRLPVELAAYEWIQVNFRTIVLPPGITGWQARLAQNTNSAAGQGQNRGSIKAKIIGQPGQVVVLRAVRAGNETYCTVNSSSISEALICEFDNLGPGVYSVEAVNTGAGLRLFVDGAGQAEIEFAPTATYATQVLVDTPPVMGSGARPKLPIEPVQPTATPSATAEPTFTPTPAFAWQGRIIDTDVAGVGTIAVRAAGLKDHPVLIRSGSWQSQPQLTGTKPEWGDFAAEFGGLPPGQYVIELVDLARFEVTLGGGEFLLVEFRYDVVSP